jgi:hypothetical protein
VEERVEEGGAEEEGVEEEGVKLELLIPRTFS